MRLFAFTGLLFISINIFGQDNDRISLFDTLYTFRQLNLTITYPFDSLYKSNNEEIEARITLRTEQSMLFEDVPLTMNLRGKFRRMKCSMPPLMLNFKKSTLRNLNLSDIDEIKLVTHCVEGKEGHDNLEEEYLVYQMYQAITPYSYRAIWLNVEYCDETKPGACIKTFGFLLEPDKVISKRLVVSERKLFNLAEDSVDFESYSNAAAFNFLIGNRDWSIVSSRNAKLFFDTSLSKYVVIPYDFDYSNVVGATYRRESLPKTMKHPYDRIYVGEYFHAKSGDIVKSFSLHKEKIYHAVHGAVNPMDDAKRKILLSYFDEWFDMVKKEKADKLSYGTVLSYKGGL